MLTWLSLSRLSIISRLESIDTDREKDTKKFDLENTEILQKSKTSCNNENSIFVAYGSQIMEKHLWNVQISRLIAQVSFEKKKSKHFNKSILILLVVNK